MHPRGGARGRWVPSQAARLALRGSGSSVDELGTRRREKGVEHVRVELPSPAVEHQVEGDVVGVRRPADAVARERVVHVRDGGDPALDRDLGPGEAGGIPRAVVALVMRERDRSGEVEELRAAAGEDPVPDLGVPLDQLSLLVDERVGLQEDVVGEPDLADVVQRARDAQ